MDKIKLFYALLVLGTVFWGISFPVTKLSIEGSSLPVFLFYRFVLASFLLWVFSFKRVKKFAFKDGFLLAMPLFLSIYLMTLGLRYVPAGECSFIAGTSVVIVLIIKKIFYNKAISKKTILSVFIALSGLYIVSVSGRMTLEPGIIYVLAGTILFSVYLVRTENYNKQKDIFPTIVPMFISCALFAFMAIQLDANVNFMPQNNNFWMGLLYCAVFSTAYMYTVSNLSQKYISAERVAVIFLFEPIFAAIASFFILGESFSDNIIIGGGLIFTGTLIAEIKWDFEKYTNYQKSK